MPTKDKRHSLNKIYQGDVVQLTVPPHSYATVMRCWHDAEDEGPPPEDGFPDPYFRPLKDGEFVIVMASDHSKRDIVTGPNLRLVDRVLRPGDFCKRAHDDVRSGVVVDARVKGRMAHVISGEGIPGWKTMDDVEERKYFELGDYVAYDDWIGQVFEVFDEALVEVQSNGQIVKLPEIGSRLFVGDRGPDIMPTPLFSNLANVINSVFGNRPAGEDTVIDVKHTVYAIGWLALNQSLDPMVAEKRQRPKQFWMGKDIGELTLLRCPSDLQMHCGDRVRLKDTTGLPVTRHGQEGVGPGVLTVDAYVVMETETTLDVLWQDGVKEAVPAKDVIPHMPDEYDCWPGDHVMWKNEDEKRAAIVQSVDAARRTATVLFPSTNTIELVSLLELDPQGTSDAFALGPDRAPDGLGVHRGEFVLIHRLGTTNGYAKPWVPKIGELEPWVREVSFDNGGWRKVMSDLGADLMSKRETQIVEEMDPKVPVPGDGTCLWFGEVTGVNLDGTVEVTHPDRTTSTYPLERLTRLFDGLDQLELAGMSMYDQDHNEQDVYEPEEVWAMEDGIWHPTSLDADDGWVDDEESEDNNMDVDTDRRTNGNGAVDLDGMDIDVAGWGSSNGPGPSPPVVSPSSPSQDSVWNQVTEGGAVTDNLPLDGTGNATHVIHSPSSTSRSSPRGGPVRPPAKGGPNLTTPAANVDLSPAPAGLSSISKECIFKNDMSNAAGVTITDTAINANTAAEKNKATEELTWKRFDILPSAPLDHAFYSSTPAQPAKSFLNRLNREYRALSNSLPDTIIVRAYEDRSDLLRSLIIGPENTPYEDAPFVIDWMLDSNFPNSPPIAHFLSWTNGNGRGMSDHLHMNPNLYEEGKVCLSILGTWAGDRTETWSAARSSLLQAFISIQGLVLVKEPWFCEPGYEKLRGTEEGAINSRLYSEKAYVLSRGFVRRALEIPPGSLEEEISWLYYKHRRLQKVLSDSRRLVDKSKQNPNPSKDELEIDGMTDVAVPRLTVGGIITLERTLGKLQGLLDTHILKQN